MKKVLMGGYAAIAALFAFYGTFFGTYSYQGFAANLGRAIVWPAILFPSLGKVIGGILMLLVITGVLIFVKRDH